MTVIFSFHPGETIAALHNFGGYSRELTTIATPTEISLAAPPNWSNVFSFYLGCVGIKVRVF